MNQFLVLYKIYAAKLNKKTLYKIWHQRKNSLKLFIFLDIMWICYSFACSSRNFNVITVIPNRSNIKLGMLIILLESSPTKVKCSNFSIKLLLTDKKAIRKRYNWGMRYIIIIVYSKFRILYWDLRFCICGFIWILFCEKLFQMLCVLDSVLWYSLFGLKARIMNYSKF